ncbi:MAG: zinc metallopeptidase [Bacteroidota bacterium]
MGYFIITIIFAGIGMFVSNRLRSKFSYYRQFTLGNGMSGREVAERMLRHYGIYDVNIVEGRGTLTDHYNPLTKTVSLSPDVYHGRHVSAAAVAAHECGHAVQHATAYPWLKFRSAIVPIVNIASTAQQYLIMGSMLFYGLANNSTFLFIAVIVFGVTALFSLVTLPVEFDASNRALAWLNDSGVARGAEYDGAKDALWWAAMTYVAAALNALALLLYFLLRFLAASSDD